MLEGLDTVDWTKYGHAYGSAADVPAMIRGLFAHDPETRAKARFDLSSSIIHQGSVYTSTPIAFPFLMEVLNSPQTESRAEVANLVGFIVESALGGRIFWKQLEAATVNDPNLSEERKAAEAKWYQEIVQMYEELSHVVLSFVPDYLALLEESNLAVQIEILALLKHCASEVKQLEPRLKARVQSETDPVLAAMTLDTLGCLWKAANLSAEHLNTCLIDLKTNQTATHLDCVRRFHKAKLEIPKEESEESILEYLPPVLSLLEIQTQVLANDQQTHCDLLVAMLKHPSQFCSEEALRHLRQHLEQFMDCEKELVKTLCKILPNASRTSLRTMDYPNNHSSFLKTVALDHVFVGLKNPTCESMTLDILARLEAPCGVTHLLKKLDLNFPLHETVVELGWFGVLAAKAVPKLKSIWYKLLQLAPPAEDVSTDAWVQFIQKQIVKILENVGGEAVVMLPELQQALFDLWHSQTLTSKTKTENLLPIIAAIGAMGQLAHTAQSNLLWLKNLLEKNTFPYSSSSRLKTAISLALEKTKIQ
jgi:hypothetical protein